MSMSRGCKLIELKPGEWWCAVAYREHDYDIESGEKFGPAKSSEDAFQMIRASNPGSSEEISFSDITDDDRELLARLDRR